MLNKTNRLVAKIPGTFRAISLRPQRLSLLMACNPFRINETVHAPALPGRYCSATVVHSLPFGRLTFRLSLPFGRLYSLPFGRLIGPTQPAIWRGSACNLAGIPRKNLRKKHVRNFSRKAKIRPTKTAGRPPSFSLCLKVKTPAISQTYGMAAVTLSPQFCELHFPNAGA